MTKYVFMMLFALSAHIAYSQDSVITGKVMDDQGDLYGAAVMIKGSAMGTTTGMDGDFSIEGNLGETLVIQYLGYKTVEVLLTKLSGNNFVLEVDGQNLEEVVVVALGTQKKNTITAAMTVVGGDAIGLRPITDATSALQGNVAGLNFSTDASANAIGGEIGGEIQFNIRGMGSINGGAPYVLVDGVEQSLQNVNPSDIQSITVLKDASAAAVYGARAAYGVVLVTTKSGREGDTKVTYSGSVGFSAPINMPQMMNSISFAQYVNDRASNEGVRPVFTDAAIDKMHQFIANPYSPELPGLGITTDGTNWASAYENQYANTDWFDYYFKDNALRHSNNLSITGGSEKVNYYIGMGYTHQGGLMDYVQDDLNKYNLNTKVKVTANKWLSFSFNNNLTLTRIRRPMGNQTIFYGTIANALPVRPHTLPIDSEYNLPNWNEMLFLKSSSYKQNRLSNALSLSATITPLKGWNILGELKGRFDVDNNDYTLKHPMYERPGGIIESIDGNRQGYQYSGMNWKDTKFGSYSRGSMFNYYLSPNISTSYENQWGKHFFKVLAGYQMEVQSNSSEYLYMDGMLSEDVYSFDNANGNVNAGEARSHWSTMGVFARLNYNYNETYFIEVSGRYDGSSRFAPNNRWGLFPSFSVGYDIAREDYFKGLNTPFSQLKVRFSYGRLGNQNGAGLYDYLGAMDIRAGSQDGWLFPDKEIIAFTPGMISSLITWEKVDNINLGIDMALFDSRLILTADIYQRTTSDMIGPAEAIPSIGGINPDDRAKINNSTLRNRGWELSVNWSDQLKNGFSYGVGFNIFDYKAVVTKYNNPEGFIYNNHTGLSRNKGYYQGMDVGEIWGYQADDLFMSNSDINEHLAHTDLSFFAPNSGWESGDLKYLDVDGDGKVDAGSGTISDPGDLRVIGNATPRYSFGINLNVGYKGFEISALFQGVGKRDFAMAGSTYLFGGKNYFDEHLDYFSPTNTDAYLPRLTDPDSEDYKKNTGYNTSRYVLNAAYFRMKNLTVSYTFETAMMERIGISNLRLYFTCDNLFTIDKLPDQFDPETLNQVNTWAGGSNHSAPALTSALLANGNGKVYPMNKNFVFGMDFTF